MPKKSRKQYNKGSASQQEQQQKASNDNELLQQDENELNNGEDQQNEDIFTVHLKTLTGAVLKLQVRYFCCTRNWIWSSD